MRHPVLITLEILLVVVGPLLALYRRGRWPVRDTILPLLILPVLWYLTYAPIHEASHALGTWLAGGQVLSARLLPPFWRGEFGQAWIVPAGLTTDGQRLLMTAAPYLLDAACLLAGFFLLARRTSRQAFTTGLLFLLLVLRPAFDLVCETVALGLGHRGDLYHLGKFTGFPGLWALMGLAILLALGVILRVLAHPRPAAPA